MKIEVTQEDIDWSYLRRAYGQHIFYSCPVAHSLRRHGFKDAGASGCFLYLKVDPSRFLATPKIVREFMESYDKGRKVNPFSFEICP